MQEDMTEWQSLQGSPHQVMVGRRAHTDSLDIIWNDYVTFLGHEDQLTFSGDYFSSTRMLQLICEFGFSCGFRETSVLLVDWVAACQMIH